MAEILIKTLGDKLFTLPPNYQIFEYYPSPNQLKNKIIIKDKGSLPSFSQAMSIDEFNDNGFLDLNEENNYIDIKLKNFNDWKENFKFNTLFDRYTEENRYLIRPKPVFNSMISKEKKSTVLSSKPNLNNGENDMFQKSKSKNELQKRISSADLKENPDSGKNKLNEYFGSKISSQEVNMMKPSTSFTLDKMLTSNSQEKESVSKNKNHEKSVIFQKILSLFGTKMNFEGVRSIWNISSINEEKISKFLKEKETEIIDFHRKYFTRIYPSGKRVDSSNYDPIDAFNAGSQLIALNVQTADNPLLLYFSKFMENGGANCGYVLKPPFLLHDASGEKYLKDFKKVKKVLNIKIISGQQLRPEDENDVRDVADPYVEVNLRGVARDESENNKTFKSITVKNNGFNPIFNLECDFKIYCPDLCLIVFKVFDEESGLKKDLKLGWYAIPFTCIREGYRIIPLLNSNLKPIEFSYLFCYISIQDVI